MNQTIFKPKRIEHNYDAILISMFSLNFILAYMIKYGIQDFSHLELDEIYDALASKEYGNYTKNQKYVHQENTVDNSNLEGKRIYDIFLSLFLRNKEGVKEKVYINIEIQNQYYPGYSLITKGQYCSARILSRQYGREFDKEEFDLLKKVYSMWICVYPSEKDANTITRYPTREIHVRGNRTAKQKEYDKQEVIMITLSKKERCVIIYCLIY